MNRGQYSHLLKLNLKRKIEVVGKPLKDWDINIYRGIVTGCNEAFIIDEAKREQLIEQDPKSTEIIKPLLRGKDIKRYHANKGNFTYSQQVTIWIFTINILLSTGHLETLRSKRMDSGIIKTKGKGLSNRDDQNENWWNLRACAYYSEFDKEKIVWQEMAKKGNFLLIETNSIRLIQHVFNRQKPHLLAWSLKFRVFPFCIQKLLCGWSFGGKRCQI